MNLMPVLHEGKYYSKTKLMDFFKKSIRLPEDKEKFDTEQLDKILWELKKRKLLKRPGERFAEEPDEEPVEEPVEESDEYIFPVVGVVIVEGFVLRFVPKYLPFRKNAQYTEELKQVLQVLKKYNRDKGKDFDTRIYNEADENGEENKLATILFLLDDYFENGVYTTTRNVVEVNGTGEILWDKTINETFTLISSGRPYYPEMKTRRRTVDEHDFFKRLHECILTECTKELDDAGLLDLFEIMGADISEEKLSDFGDKEYILGRITKELNIQFNTRKQQLLKTLYTYIDNGKALTDPNSFSIYATNSFFTVWEKVCAEVMDSCLKTPLEEIAPLLPTEKLDDSFSDRKDKTLIELIEKPWWSCAGKEAKETLEPDIITINDKQFIIFDAKYYKPTLEKGKNPERVPGIGDITKQYLYELAYRDFIEAHGFESVRNCLLMPTSEENIISKGYVSLEMLNNLGLQKVQVRMLPAKRMFRLYLENSTLPIEELNLDRREFMLGAIIGDVVGSVYERDNIKTKDFPLFRDDCHFTDDTVMTVAVAEALMNGGNESDFIKAMQKYGRMFPHAGYGGKFRTWLTSDNPKPYNSYGNGSAMRVSPVGFFCDPNMDPQKANLWLDDMAKRSAAVSHDHPEGIKGACAVAYAVWFMRRARLNNDIEAQKKALRKTITKKYGYDLSKTLDEIRRDYTFDVSCQGSVPQAITAFLESTDFEDAIRNAISLGGDSDTIAAIAGGIAEAAYGVPAEIKEKVLTYLDKPLLDVYYRWQKYLQENM